LASRSKRASSNSFILFPPAPPPPVTSNGGRTSDVSYFVICYRPNFILPQTMEHAGHGVDNAPRPAWPVVGTIGTWQKKKRSGARSGLREGAWHLAPPVVPQEHHDSGGYSPTDQGMKEIWKDIEGYEGSYQVSCLGRVRSVPRKIARRGVGLQTFNSQIIRAFPLPHRHHLSLRLRKNGVVKITLFIAL
jgi:hypothetical protein